MRQCVEASEEIIAVHSSGVYHQLIGIQSCFLPSSPSSLALCCMKIPSDTKHPETNYNASRTRFQHLDTAGGLKLSFVPTPFFSSFLIKPGPSHRLNELKSVTS